MGRAFEFRRGRKEKRWDWMAKTFTKYGREISLAVKQAGPDPLTNSRLRIVLQNAKNDNMPKDRIESAIKRASSKDEKGYEEVVYEGYGPHAVAILVETATDNPTRTVANVRLIFNRGGGSLGKSGSLDFVFQRKGVFKLAPAGLSLDDLELELIDFGLEEISQDDEAVYLYTAFTDFGTMQKALEERSINVLSATLQRIPNSFVEVTDEQAEEIEEIVDKLEQDEDVQAVYHNMK
ncbi:MAG: YebC/PmpR family DNA-binding transcriptional regulator [Bernardetiaceae bacterium]|jgi:YebC/PmpR family DNA-binding regulatory protein|nr:YebC/PmpR family DNA-binding transcriptional regulator [Bernardetiaceae bacterium]